MFWNVNKLHVLNCMPNGSLQIAVLIPFKFLMCFLQLHRQEFEYSNNYYYYYRFSSSHSVRGVDRDKNAIGSGQKCNWIGQCLMIGTKMQLDRDKNAIGSDSV